MTGDAQQGNVQVEVFHLAASKAVRRLVGLLASGILALMFYILGDVRADQSDHGRRVKDVEEAQHASSSKMGVVEQRVEGLDRGQDRIERQLADGLKDLAASLRDLNQKVDRLVESDRDRESGR